MVPSAGAWTAADPEDFPNPTLGMPPSPERPRDDSHPLQSARSDSPASLRSQHAPDSVPRPRLPRPTILGPHRDARWSTAPGAHPTAEGRLSDSFDRQSTPSEDTGFTLPPASTGELDPSRDPTCSSRGNPPSTRRTSKGHQSRSLRGASMMQRSLTSVASLFHDTRGQPTAKFLQPPERLVEMARCDATSYGSKVDAASFLTVAKARYKRISFITYVLFLAAFSWATLWPLHDFTRDAYHLIKAVESRLLDQPDASNLPFYSEDDSAGREWSQPTDADTWEEIDGWDDGFDAVHDLDSLYNYLEGPLYRSVYLDALIKEGDRRLPGNTQSEAAFFRQYRGSSWIVGNVFLRVLRVDERDPFGTSVPLSVVEECERECGGKKGKRCPECKAAFLGDLRDPDEEPDGGPGESPESRPEGCLTYFRNAYLAALQPDDPDQPQLPGNVTEAALTSCAAMWDAWKYVGARELPHRGRRRSYSSQGYKYTLPGSYLAAVTELGFLRKEGWVDGPTGGSRAVVIDATFNAPGVEVTVSARMAAELLINGGCLPSTVYASFRFTDFRPFQVYEIVYWTALGVMILLLVRSLNAFGLEAFREDPWVLVDSVNYALQLALALTTIWLKVRAHETKQDMQQATQACQLPDSTCSVTVDPTYDFARSVVIVRNTLAFAALLSWGRLLGFIYVVPKVGSLWRALGKALFPLAIFIAMCGVVLLAFGHATYLIYGLYVGRYNSLPDAVMSQVRFFTGEVGYMELVGVNRFMTPLVFTFQLYALIFVVSNVFIAIIMNYYTKEVQAETGFEFDATYGTRDCNDDPSSGFHPSLFNRLTLRQLDHFYTPLYSVELANGIYLRMGVNSLTSLIELQAVYFTKAWQRRQAHQWWEQVKHMFDSSAATYHSVAEPVVSAVRDVAHSIRRGTGRVLGRQSRSDAGLKSRTIQNMWQASCRAMGSYASPVQGQQHVVAGAADSHSTVSFRAVQESKLQAARDEGRQPGQPPGGTAGAAGSAAAAPHTEPSEDLDHLAYCIIQDLETVQQKITDQAMVMSQIRIERVPDEVCDASDLPRACGPEDQASLEAFQGLDNEADDPLRVLHYEMIGDEGGARSVSLALARGGSLLGRRASSGLPRFSRTASSVDDTSQPGGRRMKLRHSVDDMENKEDPYSGEGFESDLLEFNPLSQLKRAVNTANGRMRESWMRTARRWVAYGRLLGKSLVTMDFSGFAQARKAQNHGAATYLQLARRRRKMARERERTRRAALLPSLSNRFLQGGGSQRTTRSST